MSDERVVVEQEKCKHGLSTEHLLYPPNVAQVCPGPTRRTLTPGEYVLIEKVDGEWPEQLLDDLEGRLAAGVGEIFDALASVAGKDT